MGSQKGFTTIEVIMIVLICFVLFCAIVGVVTLHDWVVSDSAPVETQVIPETIATTPLPKVPKYQKVALNQIIAVECGEYNCGAALKAFEREYRDCNVIPIGPYSMDGQTMLYYFLVSSTTQ